MEGNSPFGGDDVESSCCVDEVAAEHIDADVVVHYGRACLSPYVNVNFLSDCSVTRLPVIYVFGRRKIDVDDLVDQWRTTVPDLTTEILLMCDTVYAHSLGSPST
jgi:diphthamide biosynthesis protein 2